MSGCKARAKFVTRVAVTQCCTSAGRVDMNVDVAMENSMLSFINQHVNVRVLSLHRATVHSVAWSHDQNDRWLWHGRCSPI